MNISVVFPVKTYWADVFILKFLKFLFPVCFFWLFLLFRKTDIQHFTIRKQMLKKRITLRKICLWCRYVSTASACELGCFISYHTALYFNILIEYKPFFKKHDYICIILMLLLWKFLETSSGGYSVDWKQLSVILVAVWLWQSLSLVSLGHGKPSK